MAAPRSLLLTAAVLLSSAGFCAFVAAPRPAVAHPQVSAQTAAVSAMALVTPQVGMPGGSRKVYWALLTAQIAGKRLETERLKTTTTTNPTKGCWNMREDVSLNLRCRLPTVSLSCHEWTRNARLPKDPQVDIAKASGLTQIFQCYYSFSARTHIQINR